MHLYQHNVIIMLQISSKICKNLLQFIGNKIFNYDLNVIYIFPHHDFLKIIFFLKQLFKILCTLWCITRVTIFNLPKPNPFRLSKKSNLTRYIYSIVFNVYIMSYYTIICVMHGSRNFLDSFRKRFKHQRFLNLRKPLA